MSVIMTNDGGKKQKTKSTGWMKVEKLSMLIRSLVVFSIIHILFAFAGLIRLFKVDLFCFIVVLHAMNNVLANAMERIYLYLYYICGYKIYKHINAYMESKKCHKSIRK